MSRIDGFQENDVFKKILYGSQNFSPKQKELCLYINENYRDVAFMTIEQISQKLNIGPATIMRTIHNLGYKSYKDLINALRNTVINQESSYWGELRKSWEKGEENSSVSSFVEITQQNISALENSISPSLTKSFEQSVSLLKKAKRIAILGLRSSKTPSYYLFFILDQFLKNSFLMDATDSLDVFSNITKLDKEDVLFVFSLGGPNYTKRTLDAIKFAHIQEIPIILVTDSPKNPSFSLADITLLVSCPPSHYSMVPIMNLLDAIIAKMGVMRDSTYMEGLKNVLIKNNILS